ALALLAFAAPLGAQQAATPTAAGAVAARARSCLDSLPPSAFVRVPVFLVPVDPDSARRSLIPVVANVVQDLADRGRAMLGGTGDTLPHGEPGITWRGIGRSLTVVWRRDGDVRWGVQPDTMLERAIPPEPGSGAGAELLGRALDSLRAAGTTFVPLPASIPGDSVIFQISMRAPMVDDTNGVHPLRERVAVPMFTIETPRAHEVRGIRTPQITYPPQNMNASAIGRIILEFVVDTTGRADMTTVRDAWPADRPRLQGELGSYYRSFVQAAKNGIRHATYDPARIGDCKVRQVVRQPFTFDIAR
ncbi:MAG: hypothetical protein HOQ09_04200, partial [Gemmatimonadaceae bacterium]|nr:hypothetical protein [Gemmatimonadaceae bacterium]